METAEPGGQGLRGGNGGATTDGAVMTAGRVGAVPATTVTESGHHSYEPPASWRHRGAAVSRCTGSSVIGVHTISATTSADPTPSAT